MTSRKAQRLLLWTAVLAGIMLVVYIPIMVRHAHRSTRLAHSSCGSKTECDRKIENEKREAIRAKLMQQFDVKKLNVKENKTDEIHLFTKKLWHFRRAEAERVYLYQRILTSEWTENRKNQRRIRYELRNHSNIDAANFVISRSTNSPNSTLDYYIFPKALRKNDNYYHYHMNDALYGRLPKVSPFKEKLYDRCSVVGNSGILLDSQCGEDIDKSDFIFRCNIAPIAPFRKDAGSKSNLTTMNPSIFFKRFGELKSSQDMYDFLGNISEYNGHIWLPCFAANHLTNICLKAFFNFNVSSPAAILANPDHFVQIMKFWSERNHTKLLSSGFYITHVALQMCKEVHLYGFWPFPVSVSENELKEQPCHYFNGEPFTRSHNMDDEFRLLFQMHQHGVLKMHVGECPSASGKIRKASEDRTKSEAWLPHDISRR
nr:sia-alpha-2,3-Gal-beta-1,4-GlcNAc-R:alpha 2,8-sialyltransferase-like [Lytechinus pictus]